METKKQRIWSMMYVHIYMQATTSGLLPSQVELLLVSFLLCGSPDLLRLALCVFPMLTFISSLFIIQSVLLQRASKLNDLPQMYSITSSQILRASS